MSRHWGGGWGEWDGLEDWDSHMYTTVYKAPASLVALEVKNSHASTGEKRDMGSIPGSGRFPGRGHGNPLQYAYLENPMDRGAWKTTVHRIAESDTTETPWHKTFSNIAAAAAKSRQSCPTLCNPIDCSLPASSVHEISQARIQQWVAISSSRESSWPRNQTWVSCSSCISRQILYHLAIWGAPINMFTAYLFIIQ